jgi:hypothetical protein
MKKIILLLTAIMSLGIANFAHADDWSGWTAQYSETGTIMFYERVRTDQIGSDRYQHSFQLTLAYHNSTVIVDMDCNGSTKSGHTELSADRVTTVIHYTDDRATAHWSWLSRSPD